MKIILYILLLFYNVSTNHLHAIDITEHLKSCKDKIIEDRQGIITLLCQITALYAVLKIVNKPKKFF